MDAAFLLLISAEEREMVGTWNGIAPGPSRNMRCVSRGKNLPGGGWVCQSEACRKDKGLEPRKKRKRASYAGEEEG